MADSKELKPRSFRIDEETAERFKEIAILIGGNQQETLAKLIEAYEFQSGKAILTEKKGDIEQFEKYVNAITRMFMGSLEDNQNITETVQTQFAALLKSKDATIQDLQEKLTVEKQLREESTIRAKSHADENARLNTVIDDLKKEFNTKMDDMQSMLSDKNDLNKALTDSCNELKAKVEEMKESAEQLSALRIEMDRLRKDHDLAIQKQADYERTIADLKQHETDAIEQLTQHESDALKQLKEQSQLALDKALLDLEKKHHAEIEQIKNEKQTEVDKYQQKYFDLLEQIKAQTATE